MRERFIKDATGNFYFDRLTGEVYENYDGVMIIAVEDRKAFKGTKMLRVEYNRVHKRMQELLRDINAYRDVIGGFLDKYGDLEPSFWEQNDYNVYVGIDTRFPAMKEEYTQLEKEKEILRIKISAQVIQNL